MWRRQASEICTPTVHRGDGDTVRSLIPSEFSHWPSCMELRMQTSEYQSSEAQKAGMLDRTPDHRTPGGLVARRRSDPAFPRRRSRVRTTVGEHLSAPLLPGDPAYAIRASSALMRLGQRASVPLDSAAVLAVGPETYPLRPGISTPPTPGRPGLWRSPSRSRRRSCRYPTQDAMLAWVRLARAHGSGPISLVARASRGSGYQATSCLHSHATDHPNAPLRAFAISRLAAACTRCWVFLDRRSFVNGGFEEGADAQRFRQVRFSFRRRGTPVRPSREGTGGNRSRRGVL